MTIPDDTNRRHYVGRALQDQNPADDVPTGPLPDAAWTERDAHHERIFRALVPVVGFEHARAIMNAAHAAGCLP